MSFYVPFNLNQSDFCEIRKDLKKAERNCRLPSETAPGSPGQDRVWSNLDKHGEKRSPLDPSSYRMRSQSRGAERKDHHKQPDPSISSLSNTRSRPELPIKLLL